MEKGRRFGVLIFVWIFLVMVFKGRLIKKTIFGPPLPPTWDTLNWCLKIPFIIFQITQNRFYTKVKGCYSVRPPPPCWDSGPNMFFYDTSLIGLYLDFVAPQPWSSSSTNSLVLTFKWEFKIKLLLYKTQVNCANT